MKTRARQFTRYMGAVVLQPCRRAQGRDKPLFDAQEARQKVRLSEPGPKLAGSKIDEPCFGRKVMYAHQRMLHVTGYPVERSSVASPKEADTAEPMELCERLASLEIDAWDSLYVEHRRLIRGVLASHLGYSAELEDVTQQVFETALDLVESGKTRLTGTPSGMRAWLVAIAVRLARSERRRSHKAARHESMPDESITSQSTEPEVWQLLTRTQALVAQLPERLRIPWLLRHLEGMRLEEIATCCGISLASTKRRLLRAERRFGALAEHDAVLREHLAERSTP